MKKFAAMTWAIPALCLSGQAGELITDDLTVNGTLTLERLAEYNVPTNGLRLYFTFDDDTGSTVTDSSETGGDGTFTGYNYQDSFKGNAAKCSSSGTYVLTTAGDLNMNGWTQLTISCWVRVDAWTTYGRMLGRGILNSGGGSCGMTLGGVYGGSPYYNSSFSVALWDGVSRVGVGAANTSSHPASIGEWTHLAGVYDGTSVVYYSDMQIHASTQVDPSLHNCPLDETANSIFCIGKCIVHPTWGDTHLNGRLDELMIFDRALSIEELQNIYDYQNTAIPAATTGGEADFKEGIRYVKPLGDIPMGLYGNQP